MAEADVVIPLDVPWGLDPDVPDPVVLQGESMLVLVARASRPSGHFGEDVVLTFEHCRISCFGYPNDEALAGHPLAQRGLGHYGIFEVLGSSWINVLAGRNRVAFPSATWPSGEPLRHFVVTFHDSTFECLASSMDAQFSAEPREHLLPSLARRLC